jgi:hypothetical protein
LEKIAQILEKVAKTFTKSKNAQNIFIKTQFESPKHLYQTPSKLLKTPTTNHIFPKKIRLGL